jgi:hypothetical protein
MLHPRAAPAGELQVWLGATGPATRLEWRLDGVITQPQVVRPFAPVFSGAGRAFTGIFAFPGVAPGSTHDVAVGTGTELAAARVRALPSEVPADSFQTFNVLLVSCFYRDEDKSGDAGRVVAQLPLPYRPDLTLLMGDQVYLDLPTLADFKSEDVQWLADKFQVDYVRNWIDPRGYAQILHAAPSAAIPDDHEYWNNAPHPSPVVPDTWHASKRANWQQAAGAMYDGFQLSAPGRRQMLTLDVEPLSFFLMDNRTFRRTDRTSTLPPTGVQQFQDWVTDVISRGRYGVIVTGQSLFQKATPWLQGTLADRHLADYDDYPAIMAGILRLARAGRPALCVTGDVHYGQVITATEAGTGAVLHEVISSPASLVTTVGKDQFSSVISGIGGLFGHGDPNRRHRSAPPVQNPFKPPGSPGGLTLTRLYPQHGEKGDHVVLLRFRRSGFGLDLSVTYFMIDARQPNTPAPSATITLKPSP